ISDGANSITGAGARTTATGIGSSQDALVNRLADLNMQELESVEVLKSATATAIYGSRATNGVVIIKSKRGTGGATQFNLTSKVGRSDAYRLLGTRQFHTVAEVRTLPYGNGAGKADSTLLAALYPSGQIPFTHDYENEFYNNGEPNYELTGNFNGGTPTTQYFVNLTGRNEAGTAPNTNARLYTLRSNVDQSLADGKVKVNLGLNIIRNSDNRGLSNNDNTCTSPIYCFAYTPGVINLDSTDATGTFVRNPFNGGGATVSNPFETFQYLRLNELTFRQIGSVNATWAAISSPCRSSPASIARRSPATLSPRRSLSTRIPVHRMASPVAACGQKETFLITTSNTPATGPISHPAQSRSRQRPVLPTRRNTFVRCARAPAACYRAWKRRTAEPCSMARMSSVTSGMTRCLLMSRSWRSTNG